MTDTPAPGLSEADATAGRFVWLFPSTAIAVLPNHAFVLFARPESPGRTVEEIVILTHPDSVRGADASEGLDQLERLWDLVNRQDLEIVERVQQGVTNRPLPAAACATASKSRCTASRT